MLLKERVFKPNRDQVSIIARQTQRSEVRSARDALTGFVLAGLAVCFAMLALLTVSTAAPLLARAELAQPSATPTAASPGSKGVAPKAAPAPAQHPGTTAPDALVARVIDILTVPSDGTLVTSNITLTQNVTYTIRVTGMYVWGGCDPYSCPGGGPDYARWADAGYKSDDDWHNLNINAPSDIFLGINGSKPDFGAYNPQHLYTTTIMGAGAPATFVLNDCEPCFEDNAGSLRVEILSGGTNDGAYSLPTLPLLQAGVPIAYGMWGTDLLGQPDYPPDEYNIAEWGSTLTSWAMALSDWGFQYNFRTAPGELNAWLRANNGYFGPYVIHTKVAEFARSKTGHPYALLGRQTRNDSKLDDLLANGTPVILYVGSSLGHWVVATGQTNFEAAPTWYINDPAYYNKYAQVPTLKTKYNNVYDQMLWGGIPAGTPDLSSITLVLSSTAELLVTDPQGRRSGTDPSSGTSYNEIPGVSYFTETLGSSVTTTLAYPIKQLYLPAPLEGNYSVQVIGAQEGEYRLTAVNYNSDGNAVGDTVDGSVQPEHPDTYTMRFSAAGDQPVFLLPPDAIAPTTTATLDPPPNESGWNTTDVTVVLRATDNEDGSRIGSIYYSAMGAQTIASTTVTSALATVQISANGVTTVTYAAVDRAGNAEDPKSIVLRVDKITPTTTSQVSPAPDSSGWNSGDVTVSLNATDNLDGSGVDHLVYSVVGAQSVISGTAASAAFTITVTAGGTNMVHYYAVDTAGNTEAEQTLTIRVDKGVPFVDVGQDDPFYPYIRDLYYRGLISGYGDNTFRPAANTTRGQLAKIVVLAYGFPIDTTGGPHFSDLTPQDPYYEVIETAYNRGIISGYGDGTIRWGNFVTRGQLIKIIVRAAGWSIDISGGPHFSDLLPEDPYYEVVETAYHHGIISGYGDGTVRWGNNATRAQISKIIDLALTGAPIVK